MKTKGNSIHEVPRFKPFDYFKKSVDAPKEEVFEFIESSTDGQDPVLALVLLFCLLLIEGTRA